MNEVVQGVFGMWGTGSIILLMIMGLAIMFEGMDEIVWSKFWAWALFWPIGILILAGRGLVAIGQGK